MKEFESPQPEPALESVVLLYCPIFSFLQNQLCGTKRYEITELGLCYTVKQQRLCYYVTVNCNKLVPVLSNLSKTIISVGHIKDCEMNT